MSVAFTKVEYEITHAQTSWKGIGLQESSELNSFMLGEVAERLNDAEGRSDFQAHLRGLEQLTSFGKACLEEILDAEIPEERDWAVGEALAEALLTKTHGVQWPWNMERDKRNPKASLPGADIVGFIQQESSFCLALGEVKTSAEEKYPPQVMSGRSGHMGHQLDTLANDLGIIHQLLKWLQHRCKGTGFEFAYKDSVTNYCNSGKKAVALFGILIRDTKANELDLKARGIALKKKVSPPTVCNLIAIYLPCKITELPKRMVGGLVS